MSCATNSANEQNSSSAVFSDEEVYLFPYTTISKREGDSNFYVLCNGKIILSTKDRELAEHVYKIPAEFNDQYAHGIVIETFTQDYLVQDEKKTGEYQIVYFGINPKDMNADASPENPIAVKGDEAQVFKNDSIGYIDGNFAGACIRCEQLDENLVSSSVMPPKYYNGWWYFSTELFNKAVQN